MSIEQREHLCEGLAILCQYELRLSMMKLTEAQYEEVCNHIGQVFRIFNEGLGCKED